MKNLLDYLDKEGVEYTIDSSPSPEKLEMIRKSIANRDKKIQEMKDDFAAGKFDEVMKNGE